ncbi:MAG: acetylornithine/succinyldiaminopimelate transaminase [Herminiimonas sp.]|uniref:acetylornithine/succinyldiaminopimelate transaminase n=1 Tax=Herminiimonas sp. TaxID=1926289 RepID=UPI00271AA10B|nr:acetylornithine/succinyldiaminopimelate transaminase [Herminiimonas sp.]MDO9422465.1 acetylornithine/succinyldiaminopimelate transaminase [Herminiimonas sp.]
MKIVNLSALHAPKSVNRKTFDEVIIPTYAPSQMVPVRGLGLEVWDQNGKRYLDFTSGIGVTALGHGHPEVISALNKQANRLWHIGNGYTNEPTLRLASSIVNATFADRVFFCNSGAEANEAAFKLARRHALLTRGAEKSRIISCVKSFHGRTLFAVSVGGQRQYRIGFGPLPKNIEHIPFNDIEAAYNAIKGDVCAVVVETIQGESGVLPATKDFLRALRTCCDRHNALLIFDEVQTGMGRVGSLFSYMGLGVTPDILTMAKALGNGFPIAAMITNDAIAKAFQPGTHGSTFGGNPLATAVAQSVFDTINRTEFLERVKISASLLHQTLHIIVNDYPHIFSEFRGQGLMIGMVLSADYVGRAQEIVRCAEKHGLMLLIAGPDVIRFLPALVVTEEQITEAGSLLRKALDTLQRNMKQTLI